MDVFICWSGDASKILAEGLRTFLRRVIQAVEPFMSSEDISKGQRWSEELRNVLAKANYGVLCMTPENISEPWIHFEAGALSKDLSAAGVSALLLDIGIADLSSPIKQFQHTKLELDDIRRLLESINKKLQRPLEPDVLDAQLYAHWADFEKVISNARTALKKRPQPPSKKRSSEEMFEEILEALNDLQRQQSTIRFADPSSYLGANPEWQQTLKAMGLGNNTPGYAKLSDIAKMATIPAGDAGITLNLPALPATPSSDAAPAVRPNSRTRRGRRLGRSNES